MVIITIIKIGWIKLLINSKSRDLSKGMWFHKKNTPSSFTYSTLRTGTPPGLDYSLSQCIFIFCLCRTINESIVSTIRDSGWPKCPPKDTLSHRLNPEFTTHSRPLLFTFSSKVPSRFHFFRYFILSHTLTSFTLVKTVIVPYLTFIYPLFSL